jgi:hypothetical protein
VGAGFSGGDPVKSIADAAAKKGGAKLIRLSVPEVRKLLVMIVWNTIIREKHALDWSDWRRRHQYQAKYYHYRRRSANGPIHDLQL